MVMLSRLNWSEVSQEGLGQDGSWLSFFRALASKAMTLSKSQLPL